MSKETVSLAVVRRLPRYYRHLHELMTEGVTRISSRELSHRLGLTASQIRQDLNCFGEFGQQGYGYSVDKLLREVGDILGLRRRLCAIMLGMGNIGRALCNNFDFRWAGVELIGLFDISPAVIGQSFGGLAVMPLERLDDFVLTRKPEVAILTMPRKAAHTMSARLSALAPIRGLWNFTNVDLRADLGEMPVEYVNFTDSLMTLCYRVKSSIADRDPADSQ